MLYAEYTPGVSKGVSSEEDNTYDTLESCKKLRGSFHYIPRDIFVVVGGLFWQISFSSAALTFSFDGGNDRSTK